MARYGLSGLVMSRFNTAFPLGTLIVNIAGCFVFGLLYFSITLRTNLPPEVRTMIFIGFLGGFTTFSTWAFEMLNLLRDGALGQAILYGVGSPLGGLAAVWAGWQVARLLVHTIAGVR